MEKFVFSHVTVEMLGRPEITPNRGGVFSIHKNIKVEDAFIGGLDRLLTLHVNSYHFSLSHSLTHFSLDLWCLLN
jgi:hypothetical protein